MKGTGDDWKAFESSISVVKLSVPLRVMVPALLISAAPLSTRGVSYEGGKLGFAMGLLLTGGSLIIGWMLYPLAGIMGMVVVFWLMGTAGVVMIVNGIRPLAFVKPICVRCRLLPVIREHEAIHMSGIASDDRVWDSMKTRYSCESLGLDGDPAICTFCPIPKRLREH